MTKQNYATYLQSPEWARLRGEAQARAGWRCQMCGARGSKGDPIEAHHRDYARLGKAGELQDVVCLCRECHAAHHHRMPDNAEGSAHADG